MDFHRERKAAADRVFVTQHGEDAQIVNTSIGTPNPRTVAMGIWQVRATPDHRS